MKNKILFSLGSLLAFAAVAKADTGPVDTLVTTVTGYTSSIGTFAAAALTIAAGAVLVRVMLKYLRKA